MKNVFKDTFREKDVALLTLDALRFDVAATAYSSGEIPHFRALLPHGFERRQTPATFTYAAHQAFFAGFFPTSSDEGEPRKFALRFHGSRSTSGETLIFNAPDIVSGYKAAGYHTICIGGTEFFNPTLPLGAVLPSLFDEAHWSREMGVTSRVASRMQFSLAAERLLALEKEQRCFLFINLAATHPPTRMFAPGADGESVATQAKALQDIDRNLPILVKAMAQRGGSVGIVCSDHGTCFAEDGRVGHRFPHENVWTVPYAEFEVNPLFNRGLPPDPSLREQALSASP